MKEFKQDLNQNKKEVIEGKIKIQTESIEQLKMCQARGKNYFTNRCKRMKNFEIKNFKDLVELCEKKKEMKIKYELENNFRLVSFKNQKIEISF